MVRRRRSKGEPGARTGYRPTRKERKMVMGELKQETELVVIGAGPGGYAAAFRAADLGLDVTLVDEAPKPGGVCLYRGCIPSKTFLSLAEVIEDADRVRSLGVSFPPPDIDLNAMRAWKARVVEKLSSGLARLCQQRGVQYVQARAQFEDSRTVRLQGAEVTHLTFEHALLATGSVPRTLPNVPVGGGRVMDSTGALVLPDIPRRLLVIGGGYVGLELGSLYAVLGSRVTVAVRGRHLLTMIDPDLVRPLATRLDTLFHRILYQTTPALVEEHGDRVEVELAGKHPGREVFDRVLVAVGRRPNSGGLGLERTAVELDERGFVVTDSAQRSTDPAIFAVGDVAGGALLAHKAMREGKVAAEVIAGLPAAYDVRALPAVVYTDPQIAWAGLSEREAEIDKRPVKVARFPWSASGRALTMGAGQGLTKMLFDPDSQRLVGIGIVGRGAEALIAEGTLAIEMGALADDLALTIHAHPTLSETEAEAAEVFLGTATHLFSAPGKS